MESCSNLAASALTDAGLIVPTPLASKLALSASILDPAMAACPATAVGSGIPNIQFVSQVFADIFVLNPAMPAFPALYQPIPPMRGRPMSECSLMAAYTFPADSSNLSDTTSWRVYSASLLVTA